VVSDLKLEFRISVKKCLMYNWYILKQLVNFDIFYDLHYMYRVLYKVILITFLNLICVL